ncbi:hypothetical protein [Moraxella sp. ZY210820]|uniref:hypothetical protein n=1 Tax=Moraxella sp. ZY210820 TaxID=2904123 RepID=UPI002731E92E|nr:hypothetical protein [Moraxella sp. ZY210820]WLF84684.1 hypothetical protein LU301_04205 [Moraxella sp. ZY210820]
MKLLKLSATALIIAGANVLFSQSALACQDSGSGRCGNQGYSGNTYNGGYYGYGNYGGYGGSFTHKYVAVAFDRHAQPFIYRNTFRTPDYVFADWDEAVGIVLQACNSDPNRSPCRYGSSATNKNCVVYAFDGNFMMSNAGSCSQTKKALKRDCKAHYGNNPACNAVKVIRP